MSYSVIPIEKFKKEAKRLIKKYPSLKNELILLEKELAANPLTGIPLGNNTFKIRLSVKSKGKGKSGGSRVITYVISKKAEVYLLTIYDKAEFDIISDKIIAKIIDNIVANQ